MRRTQIYLEEDLWKILRERSLREGTSVSELVRKAVREQYLGKSEQRRDAMLEFAGSRKDRTGLSHTAEYIRSLRRGNRIERLRK